MSASRTVSKNTSVLFLGYCVSYALRFVYIGALARYVGPRGIGEVSTATALLSILSVVVDFGFDTLVVRELAAGHPRAGRFVFNVAAVRLFLSAVLATLLVATISLSSYPDEARAIIAIYGLTYVLDSFAGVARSVFHGFQKMEYSAAVDLTRDIVNVALSMLGIWLGWPLVAIVGVSLLASALKLTLSALLAHRRFVRLAPEVDLALCRQLLKSAIPFAVLLGIGVLQSQLGTVILSWIGSVESVGIYSAAAVPIGILLVLPTLFMESVLPAFAQAHRTGTGSLGPLYERAYKVALIVGLPLGAGTILVADYIVPLIYGEGFEGAALVMRILAIQLLTMVGFVNGAFLNATNRQTLFAVLRTGMVVLNAALCLALIPAYGYRGAALAAVVPAVLDFGIYSVLCHHYAGASVPWLTGLRAALGAGVMWGTGYLALEEGISIFLVVPAAAIVYGTALVILGVIGAGEWQFFKAVVPLKRVRGALSFRAGG